MASKYLLFVFLPLIGTYALASNPGPVTCIAVQPIDLEEPWAEDFFADFYIVMSRKSKPKNMNVTVPVNIPAYPNTDCYDGSVGFGTFTKKMGFPMKTSYENRNQQLFIIEPMNKHPAYTATGSAIKTDGNGWVLILICCKETGFPSWVVLAKENKVSAKDKADILSEVETRGFSKEDAYSIDELPIKELRFVRKPAC